MDMVSKLKLFTAVLLFVAFSGYTQNLQNTPAGTLSSPGISKKNKPVLHKTTVYPKNIQHQVAPHETGQPCLSGVFTRQMDEQLGLQKERAELKKRMAQIAQEYAQRKAPAPTGPIPVIFHVIYENPTENVSNTVIQSLINELNEDYQLLNADQTNARTGMGFIPANPDITFCLAQRDPLGNQLAEPGVHRVPTTVTWFDPNTMANDMKYTASGGTEAWDRNNYLNVWICDITNGATSGTAGYAYVPTTTSLPPADIDGVVIDYNIGTTPGSNVLTHEVGHFLGLSHVWDVNDVGGCSNDDGFTDTPNTDGPSFNYPGSCSGSQQTCPGIETQYENYMDYSNCTVMFTSQQANYMNTILTGIRASLLSSNGCVPVNALDAGISAVISPSGSQCGTTVYPEITIENYGSTTLSDGTILYNIDGVNTQTYNWTASTPLSTNQTENVTLPSITTTVGTHTFNVTIANPNGGSDQNSTNDVMSVNITVSNGNAVTVEIHTDDYGYDTYWEVLNTTSTVVAFGGNTNVPPGGQQSASITDPGAYGSNITVTESLCLADGCYTFKIYDDWGDGILTTVTPPTYQLYDDMGNTLVTGGAFNTSISHGFCVPMSAPTADFTANFTNIPVNSLIYYQDLSTNNPNAWNWDFQGGLPPTSTAQNPGVFYNAVGTYDASLTVTNSFGSDNVTKPSYITVYNPSGGACDTLHNLSASESPIYYTLGSGGYFPGTNSNPGMTAFADKFSITSQNVVQKIVVPVFRADVASANPTVTFAVWDDNGGVPGNILSSETLSYASLTPLAYNTIVFSQPPVVNGTFYAGFIYNSTAAGDTIVLGCAPDRSPNPPATAFCTYGGSWYDVDALFSSTGGFKTSIDVQVFLSEGMTDANFVISPNPVCEGDNITFDASASFNASDYYWDLNGDGTIDALGVTVTTPMAGGNYTTTLYTLGGCNRDSFKVALQVDSVRANVSVSDVSCFGANDGAITVSAYGSGTSFNYLWSNSATTSVGSGLSAGTYTVTITDNNGCSNSGTFTITEPTAIGITLTSTSVTAPGANDGTVSSTVSGGAGSYTYLWSNGATTGSQTGLAGGVYCMTATDANGCTASACVTIDEPVSILITLTTSDETCGDGTGSVTVSASGGVTPYTYSWSTGATTQIITGLSAGSYTVTVYDNAGASNTATATINNNTGGFATSISYTDENCGLSDGSITVTASGGTTPYTYNWSNGATTYILTGLSAGTYSITTSDASGCIITDNVTITNNTGTLSASISSTQETCTASDAIATANVSGGNPPYSYSWSSGQTDAMITGLSAGTYTLTVSDATGCIVITGTTITQNSGSVSVNLSVTDEICGNSMGSITANVSGASFPVNYMWSNGQSMQTATGLSAGVYTVTVTDANGCVVSATGTVTNSAGSLSVSTSSSAEHCGQADGVVIASASGGASPYSYSWDIPANTASVSGLSTGIYSVTVTDNNGCAATGSTTVSAISGPNVTVMTSPETCSLTNGSASVSASGSTPFTYAWSNGASTSTITGLAGGSSYTVTVTDAYGCPSVTTTGVIPSSSGPSLTFNTQDVSCNGGNDGAVTVTVSGGVTPFTYLWNTGSGAASISGLSANIYSVTVSDNNGCSSSGLVTINEPGAIAINFTTTPASCGANDGSATAIVGGGSSGYAYSWSNGNTTATISNVASGNYSVTVTDANGCSNSATVNIGNTAGMTITVTSTDVLCNGGSSGTATVSYMGGTAPYSIAWSNGASTNSVSNLTAGQYYVTVTDANGCQASGSSIISEPSALVVLTSSTNENCSNGQGSVSANISGGISPYSVVWNTGATTTVVNNLSSGTYTVTVTDANNCSQTASATVSNTGSVSGTVSPSSTTLCDGSTATITAGGGNNYLWSTGSTNSSIVVSAGGIYTVTISDNSGCADVQTATVTVVPLPNTQLTASSTVICAGESVTLTASGGTSYVWTQFPSVTGNTVVTTPGQSNNTYSVVAYNGTCAGNTASVDVQWDPTAPIASACSDVTDITEGETVNFSAFDVFNCGTGNSVGDSFSWDFNNDGIADTSFYQGQYTYTTPGTYEAVLTVYMNGSSCVSTDTIIITVNPVAVGITPANTQAFALYPNPTTGKLFLTIPASIDQKTEVIVYDAIGKQVYGTSLTEQNAELDLMNLQSGIYFVSVRNTSFSKTVKINLIR